MGVKTAIAELIESHPDVVKLVGSRIYQDFAQRSALERLYKHGESYITFQQTSNVGGHSTLTADVTTRLGFQVDVWAPTTAKRETLTSAIRLALDGYRGHVGDADIRHIALENKGTDSVEEPETAKEKPIFRSTITATVWIAETAPTF